MQVLPVARELVVPWHEIVSAGGLESRIPPSRSPRAAARTSRRDRPATITHPNSRGDDGKEVG
jgi:hypothetical protein